MKCVAGLLFIRGLVNIALTNKGLRSCFVDYSIHVFPCCFGLEQRAFLGFTVCTFNVKRRIYLRINRLILIRFKVIYAHVLEQHADATHACTMLQRTTVLARTL